MRPESVTGAFDLDDDGVVQQPVEQGGGHHWVAEHLGPFGEVAVGGEDHGAFFVAGADQLEEQIGAFLGQRQVADLIDDEKGGSAVKAQLVGDLSGAMGDNQRVNQVSQGAAIDAVAGLDRGDPQGTGEMAFAGAGPMAFT